MGEAEAEMLFIAWAEGVARRDANGLFREHALHEREARPEPPHARKGIERALRLRELDARAAPQHLRHDLPPPRVLIA